MKKAKLFAVLSVLVLLCACVAGVLMTGTSAADEAVQWTVDGTTYSSIKAALTAAEKETWAATQSLVITVDPTKQASESISHDANGTAYAGGIAFGQKTIFRADGTRLPITIKGSSDRTAFTLNITAGTKVACANSYTFENLTFPIGDTSDTTIFFAGSGIVRLENVATGSGVLGKLGGDNFTARAYEGWTADKIAANDDSEGKILSSLTIGKNVKYVHNIYACNTAAVHDDGGWDSYAGVTLTPSDTKAEIVLDGGEVGYFRNRLGTGPVAESIQRVESGTVSGAYMAGSGAYVNSVTFTNRKKYTGDMTVIINGGTINGTVRLLHTGEIDGDYTIQINGGTINGLIQPGMGENVVTGDFIFNITGGTFTDEEGYGIYGTPEANVGGRSILTISGGTFNCPIRGSRGNPYVSDTDRIYIPNHIINIMPNADATKPDPVFNDPFYGARDGDFANLTINISGGTFKSSFNLAVSRNITNAIVNISGGTFDKGYIGGATGTGVVTNITNNISGGIFKDNFYGGGMKGSTSSVTNNVYNATFNSMFHGGNAVNTTGNVVNNIYGGTFNHFYIGAGVASSVGGNVTNNISGGTFAKSAFGGTFTGTIAGTIYNNICGTARFETNFVGVNGIQDLDADAKVGAVVNRVYKDAAGNEPFFKLNTTEQTCIFNGVTYSNGSSGSFCFLGGATYAEVTGTITNTIEAGVFEVDGGLGCYGGGSRTASIGKDENGVSIYNYVKGGTFLWRWYGGCMSGTPKGEIYNEITGGTFRNEFTGGYRYVATSSTPITTVIKGGEFFKDVHGVYRGYNENQGSRAKVSSAVTITVEDGIFHGNIYGLGNFGSAYESYTGAGINETGSVKVTLNGGIFHGTVSPTCPIPIEANMLGLAQVTVEPKAKDITFYGSVDSRFDAEKIAIKGGEYKILVDAKGSVEATSAEGTIKLEQIDKWKNATYLTLPAGHTATVNVSTAPDAYGYYETVLGENDEVIQVNGVALKMGASMILTDRIALKFQLSKTAVDAVENFTYSFTLPDGTVLAEGTKADLSEMMEMTEFEYYTFVLKALGIGQFDTPITVNIKGLWENDTFSISTLAESAVTAWEGNDNLVIMAKSIVNMAKAAKGESLPYALTPDAVEYERKTPTFDDGALVSFTQKSLLMSSAVGVRLSGTVANAADAQGLAVKVNGNDVTHLVNVTVEGNDVTVDLYFSAYGMSKEFELQILDKNGKSCLTMLERLDSFADQYGAENALARSLLSYIQATSTMAKASFNMQASQAEIDYLNSLYAGETAYYGDLHGHPGGGIIEDGKVHMSVWVSDRESIGVDFYTAMNHKQVAHMYDEGWDDSVLIGGSEPATTVTKDGNKISVHYNMIVPNPEALIEVLQLFPEFNYTGGTGDIEINMGTFGYPKFTYDRFNELISAIKERGGTVVNVHPKQQHTSDNPLDYYYQDYMGLEVFYSYSDKNIHGQDSEDNYKLWTDLLALGKRVWATAGSDSHSAPVNTGLTTLYSSERLNTKYVEKIVNGNFAPGYVGIRMAIGDTEMGGHTDFEGKKLIFSVGDFHSKYLDNVRAYKVNVITDQGVVYSTVVDGTKTSYFSLDADENAAFYRIEVVDEDIAGLPIVGLGNPIWND